MNTWVRHSGEMPTITKKESCRQAKSATKEQRTAINQDSPRVDKKRVFDCSVNNADLVVPHGV